MTSHRGVWDRLVPNLARYRCITYDARGHGQSGWTDPPRYNPSDHALDLDRLMATVPAEELVVVAHSAGALAAALCLAAPNRSVAGFVWIDIDPCVPKWQVEHFNSRAGALSRTYPTQKEATQRIAAGIQKTSPELDMEALEPFVAGMVSETNGAWGLAIDPQTFATWNPEDVTPLLPKIACPTLVIRGDKSIVSTQPGLEALSRGLPRAVTETLPSGHFPMLESPALLSERIIRFVTKEVSDS